MRPSTRTLSLRIAAASFAAAGAIFGGLAVQMANGHDPALGTGTSSSQHQSGSTPAAADTSPAPVITRAS